MAAILEILARLAEQEVEFVLVGGMAGVVHGSAVVTEDVDVCAPLDDSNLTRICAALGGLNPRWRMSPGKPAAPATAEALRGFKNIYWITDAGQIDILSDVSGIGDYTEVARHSVTIDLGGVRCRVLDLDTLIAAKRAMGRPKDLHAATELEAIRERLREG